MAIVPRKSRQSQAPSLIPSASSSRRRPAAAHVAAPPDPLTGLSALRATRARLVLSALQHGYAGPLAWARHRFRGELTVAQLDRAVEDLAGRDERLT